MEVKEERNTYHELNHEIYESVFCVKEEIDIKCHEVESNEGSDQDLVSEMSSRRRRSIECPKYHHLVAKPNTKSRVWEYFGLPADESGSVLNDNITVCKICASSVSSKGGSTSNMCVHLKLYHPNAFKDIAPYIASKKSTVLQCSNDPLSTSTSIENSPSPSTSHSEVNHVYKKQKYMFDFEPLDSVSSKNCTDSVSEFLATTMQPYTLVEHKKFQKMINTLNPRYTLPGRNFFTKTGVPKLYNDTIEKMKRELLSLNEDEVSITTDCWTSIAGTSYIAVTTHFITSEWELRSFCLSCKNFEEDHTAENICEVLEDILSQWQINARNIASCTTDNGSNILKAVHQLGVNHVSCFGHNINIGVNHALSLPQIKRAVARLKKLQNVISQSWKMKRDLKKAQELLNMKIQVLPSACPTRWWSTLKLCRRFLDNKLPISKVLMDYRNKKHLMLEGNEVSALQDFVSATTMLEGVLKTLSGEDYVTGSSVLPFYRKIKKSLQPEETDSELLKNVKKEILGKLAEKYEKEPLVSLLRMASLCDPRFCLRFMDSIDAMKMLALEKMAAIYERQEQNMHANPCNDDEPAAKKIKKGLAKFFDEDDDDDNESPTIDSATPVSFRKAEQELKSYLAIPKVGFEQDPLTWWKAHQSSYPTLKVLARKYLAIQGSSVPSERVFSTGENVITKHRVALLPKHAEMQVYLAHNSDFV